MTVLLLAGILGFILLSGYFYRYPVWGIGMLAFVAPLEKLSVYHGLTWKPFLVIFPAVFLAFLLRRVRRVDPWPRLNLIDKTLIALFAINFLSATVAVDVARTIRMTVQFGILYAICSMTIHTLKTESDTRKVLFCTFLSGGLVVSYGLLQLAGAAVGVNTHLLLLFMPRNPTIPYMMTIPGAVYFESLGRHIVRVSSTFFDWNFFAGYLVALGSLAWLFFCRRYSQGRRRLHLGVLLSLTVLLLLFSFSRSGWIGASVSFVIAYGLSRSAFPAFRRRLVVGIGLFLVAIALSVPGSPLSLAVKRMRYMFSGDPSIEKHVVYGEKALEMFYRSPILGVGLHNYSVYYNREFDPNDPGTTAHSTFLAYFAETGLLGASANVFFHLLSIALMIGALRRQPTLSFSYTTIAGVLAGYVGILACNLFYFFNNQAFIWTFLGLGLAEAVRAECPAKEAVHETDSPKESDPVIRPA
jgi:O-antigen ligase